MSLSIRAEWEYVSKAIKEKSSECEPSVVVASGHMYDFF